MTYRYKISTSNINIYIYILYMLFPIGHRLGGDIEWEEKGWIEDEAPTY